MRSRGQAFVVGLACLLGLLACRRDHAEREDAGTAGGKGGAESAAAGGKANQPPQRQIGARAVVRLEGVATGDGVSGVTGTAMFSQTAEAVNLSMMISQCRRDAKPYEVYVKEGLDCSEATLQGPNWDGSRGEGLQAIQCATTSFGRGLYSRPNDDAKPWSIGAPAASDLLGHALVVVDASSGAPVACGIIGREAATSNQTPVPDGADDIERLAPLAGLCLGRSIVRVDTPECPDPKALVDCAMTNCDLASCRRVCADYTACLAHDDDACSALFECPLTEECSTCQTRVQGCVAGFCLSELTCASPTTPDGACSQLKACCAIQGDQAAACLETVKLFEQLSGDPSCADAMRNWDFAARMKVACEFE